MSWLKVRRVAAGTGLALLQRIISQESFPALLQVHSGFCYPEGFCRSDPKTFLGNRLAFMAVLVVRVCLAYAVACILENPRRSKMFWLKVMRALRKLAGIVAVDLPSCTYGSPHLKEFKLVGCHVDLEPLRSKCACPKGTKHLPVQGKYAKQSAVYTPRLSQAIARVFVGALSRAGLESLLVNDTLLTAKWVTEASWPWDKLKHINVYESESALALLKHVALKGGDRRLVLLLDSAAAKGALAKGRSSAQALWGILSRRVPRSKSRPPSTWV